MHLICEKLRIFGMLKEQQRRGNIPHSELATGMAIKKYKDEIILNWKDRVTSEIKEARGLPHPIIVDTMPTILDKLCEKLSAKKAMTVSEGTLAEEHGGERARLTDFNLTSLIQELCILRDVILKLLYDKDESPDEEDRVIIYQFIDKIIQDSATSFSLIQADLREQVMATLTHDMRSPLTAATLGADMILRKSKDESILAFAKKIKLNHQRIDGMIQDLLNTTLLRSGGKLNLKIERANILEIAQDIYEVLSPDLKKRLNLQVNPVVGFWDRGLLRRAIDNLISNAFKYGSKDSKITLMVTGQNGRTAISVNNHGPVIPKEEQETIFQIFRRAEAAKRGNRQGWGLGLPLVRTVAESHGGSIGIVSSLETGTTFTIDIPDDARPYQNSLRTE